MRALIKYAYNREITPDTAVELLLIDILLGTNYPVIYIVSKIRLNRN